MIKTNPFFKIIRNIFFLAILQLAFSGCEPNNYVFEVKNQSDYDLSIVFKGKPLDSVERLIFVYNFNEDFFDRPYSKLVDSATLVRLLTEFSNPNIFKNRLNYLIDSGYVFSFAEGLLPTKSISYYPNAINLTIKKDKVNIIDSIVLSYYKDKNREYFRNMIIHNWFAIPLPKNSSFSLNNPYSHLGKGEFILCTFPDLLNFPNPGEIRIMHKNIIIKTITETSFYRIESGTRYFKGYKYSQLKIENKDVEKELKIRAKN
jgi:hypothetical protein